jgi:hypothetical protein
MIELVHPAPFLELLGMLRSRAPNKPRFAELSCLQISGSATVGFVEDGQLLAAMGFWPLGDGADEVFLIGLPSDVLAPRMLALTNLARLTLAARLHSGTVAIVGHVKIGHVPGERLARLAGFSPCDGAPSGFSRWELRHGQLHSGAFRRWRQLLEESVGRTAEAARTDADFAGAGVAAGQG